MNFLITGGAGFIGSHTVDELIQSGDKVKVLDNFRGGRLANITQHLSNPNFKFLEKDIRTIELDNDIFEDVDCIIHFAGLGDIVPSINNPIEYFSVNSFGTTRILEAARLNSIRRVVYAASSSCYGVAQVPTNEDCEISTEYPYAFSKFIGEKTAFHWAKVYGLEVNSIRIFNAYGTRSRTSGTYGAVFGVFLKQLIEKQPLTVVGDGTQKRDFVYVTDVAKAFVLAAKTAIHNEVFNIGGGDPISINQIVSILSSEHVSIPERPGEPKITWADISKAENLLDWIPQISIETGIRKMLENLEYWKDAPLWNPDSIFQETKEWFHFLTRSERK
jgi:UDP-glucose 4-epimerase